MSGARSPRAIRRKAYPPAGAAGNTNRQYAATATTAASMTATGEFPDFYFRGAALMHALASLGEAMDQSSRK